MITIDSSYYRARYYDPQSGRFISEDPVEFNGGVNFYSYGLNNPASNSDPSRKWVSWIHKDITKAAAINAGYSTEQAAALAQAVSDVDFLPGSQSTDFEDANLHAMSGKTPNGLYQMCFQAYGTAMDQLEHYIEVGNPAAIAAALHMIQDSYSPAHAGYAEWDGGGPFGWPGIAHVLGDVSYGQARHDALIASQQFLRDLAEHSSALKYPSNYLKANPCGCEK